LELLQCMCYDYVACSEVAYRRIIYASLNGALGLDDVALLSAKQIRLTGELFCEWHAISNFYYMLGLCDCLQYYLLANVNSRSRSLYAIARPSVCRL